jgi:hypothetical protein
MSLEAPQPLLLFGEVRALKSRGRSNPEVELRMRRTNTFSPSLLSIHSTQPRPLFAGVNNQHGYGTNSQAGYRGGCLCGQDDEVRQSTGAEAKVEQAHSEGKHIPNTRAGSFTLPIANWPVCVRYIG